MIRYHLRAFLAGGVAALLAVATSVPAHAQWIVFDPTNYAQNLPIAVRELQQVDNEIESLENQATMLPELGHVTREQAASLAGLAPFVRQSGKWQGQAHIGGGRSRLRRSLFAAAFPGAHHWNKALMELHGRMRARGASHTCAIVACARKLLVQVNAVVARGTLWEERPAVVA